MEKQGKQKRLLRRQRTRRIIGHRVEWWNNRFSPDRPYNFDLEYNNWMNKRKCLWQHRSKGRFDNWRHYYEELTRDEIIFNQVADCEIKNLNLIEEEHVYTS